MGDDGSRGIKVISDHFEGSPSSVDSPQARTPSTSHPRINNPSRYFFLLAKTKRKRSNILLDHFSWFCLFCISIAPIAIRGLGKNLEVLHQC